MDLFINIFVTILALYVLFIPKGHLAVKLQQVGSAKEMGMINKMSSYIPFYNNILIRNAIFGGSGFTTVLFWLFCAIHVFNLIARFVLFSNGPIQVISTMMVILSLLIWYLVEVVTMVQVALLFQPLSIKLVVAVIPALHAALLRPRVEARIREEKDNLEGTFDGKRKQRKRPSADAL